MLRPSSSRLVLAFVVTLGSLGLARPASATLIAELTVEQMSEQADAIVHATVVRVAERTLPMNGRLVPFRLTTLEVREWLKGQGGPSVVVRELGGESRGVRTEREGTPLYRRGEEVIVFLRRDGDSYTTLGMAQGRYRVRGDDAHGHYVERDLDGLSYVQRDGSQVDARSVDRRTGREALFARVRAAVRTTGGGR